MDGGAGDELPSFNEQGFDVLVDGDAQTRWLVEQLAIMDGANTPGVPANLHKCPGVAQAAATSLERAQRPIPANHASADTFALYIFGSHPAQGIFQSAWGRVGTELVSRCCTRVMSDKKQKKKK